MNRVHPSMLQDIPQSKVTGLTEQIAAFSTSAAAGLTSSQVVAIATQQIAAATLASSQVSGLTAALAAKLDSSLALTTTQAYAQATSAIAAATLASTQVAGLSAALASKLNSSDAVTTAQVATQIAASSISTSQIAGYSSGGGSTTGLAALSGANFIGPVKIAASTSTQANFIIEPGVQPLRLVDTRLWVTTTGIAQFSYNGVVYSLTTTHPTDPDTFANVSLLLHFDEYPFVDSSANHYTITDMGDAYNDTLNQLYGTSCGAFGGAPITLANGSPSLDLTVFSIEFWLYIEPADTGQHRIIQSGTGIDIATDNTDIACPGFTASDVIVPGEWAFFLYTYNQGGTVGAFLYKNASLVASNPGYTTSFGGVDDCQIGGVISSDYNMRMEDFRISRLVRAPFIPTQALPSS